MVPSTAPAQLVLPDQFNRGARRAHIAGLDRTAAVKFGAEVLMRGLNALAFDPFTTKVDPSIGSDPRFRSAVSVAVPLSLSGAPARRETLMDIAGRTVRLARERGLSGPAGRALEAAKLLCMAALDHDVEHQPYVERAVELTMEAEALAACVHGQDPAPVRAAAEVRALGVAQPR